MSADIPEKHFSTTFKPRFRDTDRVGHVNNAVFATYIENCRVDWLHEIHDRKELQDIRFIIARIEIDYIKPIHLGGMLRVFMWVSRIGTKSWTFDFAVTDNKDGTLHARAKSVQVIFNYQTDKTEPLNDAARSILSELYNE